MCIFYNNKICTAKKYSYGFFNEPVNCNDVKGCLIKIENQRHNIQIRKIIKELKKEV